MIFVIMNVVIGSLESFFQLNHQVDISLYLTEATALWPLLGISRFETTMVYFSAPLTFRLPGL